MHGEQENVLALIESEKQRSDERTCREIERPTSLGREVALRQRLALRFRRSGQIGERHWLLLSRDNGLQDDAVHDRNVVRSASWR